MRRQYAELEARGLDFLSLVKRRFEPYVGLSEKELAELCGYGWQGKRKPKNLCALITQHILGVEEDAKIVEFEKAGVKAKTMRVKRNGMPKESISFPAFDYFKLATVNLIRVISDVTYLRSIYSLFTGRTQRKGVVQVG